jgi:CheY-like chemotaxis protein
MDNDTNILVVDDNPDNLQVISAFLKEKDYNIALAMNGQKALSTLDSINIDLILLDILMPEMDGFEVCRQIRKNEKTKDIPIIFITAQKIL